MIVASWGNALSRVSNLPTLCPFSLQIADSTIYASWLFICLLSKTSINASKISQPSLVTFNIFDFKVLWLLELRKFSPSHFPGQWLWVNIFIVFSPLPFSKTTSYGEIFSL